MMKITGNYLVNRGWERKGHWLILKDTLRFGWNEETKELIAGYTLLPFTVEYVYELATVLTALRVKMKTVRETSGNLTPIIVRYSVVLEAAQQAVGKRLEEGRRSKDVLIRVFTAYRLRREGYPYEAIGGVMNRNHATIIHYVEKKMDGMLSLPKIYREEIEMYNRMKEMLDE